MRLSIINDKDMIVHLITEYLSTLLVDHKVDLIINGDKRTNTIKKIELEPGEISYIIITIGKKEERIPILDETKARFGQELVVLETKTHTTVIEILD